MILTNNTTLRPRFAPPPRVADGHLSPAAAAAEPAAIRTPALISHLHLLFYTLDESTSPLFLQPPPFIIIGDRGAWAYQPRKVRKGNEEGRRDDVM